MVKLNISSMSCIYGIVAMVLTTVIDSASVEHVMEKGGIEKREKRGVRGRNFSGFNGQYQWLCPSVLCEEVSPSCKTREFIVYEFYYQQPNGRRVNVRCESCPYCLDYPGSSGLQRKKRSSRTLTGVHRRRYHHEEDDGLTDCHELRCPNIAVDCLHVQFTDVILRNRRCKQCPACFDDTIFGILGL